MRSPLLLGLLLCLVAGAAEASPWPWRIARRSAAEVALSKPPPECSALSDADFQSAWQLLEEKCPKDAPFLVATDSDCWKGMDKLEYKCAKAAARAAANGTDVTAAVGRIKNLYRSNPTAMITWAKEERPVPVPSPPPSPPSPSPPVEPSPSPPPPAGNETAGNETATNQSSAGTNGTEVVPATTLPSTTLPSNASNDAAAAAEQAAAAEAAAAAKKQEEAAAAAAKKQEEAAAAAKKKEEEPAAAKKKREEAAAAAAKQKQEQEAAAAAAAAAAGKRSPSPKPKNPGRVPSPTPGNPVVPSTGGAITRAQVAIHNTATNCWYIHGIQVVNVTPYLTTSRHPGGNAVIVRYCGKDATAAFNSAHSTGPAVAQQQAYVIGTLAA
ncbi:succinate [Chlorella sorokiniana]|uniref:Succinate n=1 Tax=Chlorella sorokiniana TaxID=3076 RepID=A0A2P6U0I3_CHLSO|nr:succinate [Chlorella sorokiniana]|eukprot:PRW59810.1 succinate [Chlorella sorokiniana]